MQTNEANLLNKAYKVLKERRCAYGDPHASFSNIAQRWSKVLSFPVTPEQAILCMIEIKRARLDYNPTHEDSQVDILGYQICLDEIRQENKKQLVKSA